jgi:hypothetical protein
MTTRTMSIPRLPSFRDIVNVARPTSKKSFEVFLSIFVKKTSPSWCSADCQPAGLQAIASAKGYEIGPIDEAEWPYERGLCLKVLERSLRLRDEAVKAGRQEPLIDGRLIRDVCTGSARARRYGPYLEDFFGPESSDDGQSLTLLGSTRLGSLSSRMTSSRTAATDGTGSVGAGSGSITRELRRMRSRLTGRGGEPSQGSLSSAGDTAD